jgi:hypothetical protein
MTPEQFRAAFCLSPKLHNALKRCRLAPREARVGDVRFGSHSGLKSDIAPCPKSANFGSDPARPVSRKRGLCDAYVHVKRQSEIEE